MGKTKKDTNARVAGRGKQTKERKRGGATVCGQLCMDNISNGLNESDDSSISDSSEESLSTSLLLLSSSEIFTEPFFSLTTNSLPALYDSYSFIRLVNFRFLTH